MGFITKTRQGRKVLAGLLREGQLLFGVFSSQIPTSATCPDSDQFVAAAVGRDDLDEVGQINTLHSYFTTCDVMLGSKAADIFKSTQKEITVATGNTSYLLTDRYITMALL